MAEKMYLSDCPVCSSKISVTLDTSSEDIAVRPEDLPPLARDRMAVVSAYKKAKGLGPEWTKTHGARAIVYAGELLEALGPAGGAVDKALALVAWCAGRAKPWDLSDTVRLLPDFNAYRRELSEASKAVKCRLCTAEELPGHRLCADHFFCWECREDLTGKKWGNVKDRATCQPCQTTPGGF